MNNPQGEHHPAYVATAAVIAIGLITSPLLVAPSAVHQDDDHRRRDDYIFGVEDTMTSMLLEDHDSFLR